MNGRKTSVLFLTGLFVLLIGSVTKVYAQTDRTVFLGPCMTEVHLDLGRHLLNFEVMFDGIGGAATEGDVVIQTTEPAYVSIIAPRILSQNETEYICQISTIMTPSGINMYMINVHPPQPVMPSSGP